MLQACAEIPENLHLIVTFFCFFAVLEDETTLIFPVTPETVL